MNYQTANLQKKSYISLFGKFRIFSSFSQLGQLGVIGLMGLMGVMGLIGLIRLIDFGRGYFSEANIPQAAMMSSPRDVRIVAMIPLEFR